jgi:hypothetical protein
LARVEHLLGKFLVEVDLFDLQGVEVLAPGPRGAAQQHAALDVYNHLVLVRALTEGVGVPPLVPLLARHPHQAHRLSTRPHHRGLHREVQGAQLVRDPAELVRAQGVEGPVVSNIGGPFNPETLERLDAIAASPLLHLRLRVRVGPGQSVVWTPRESRGF